MDALNDNMEKPKKKLGRPPRAEGKRSVTFGFSLTNLEVAKMDQIRAAMTREGKSGIESVSRAEFVRLVLRSCIGSLILGDIKIPCQVVRDIRTGRRALKEGEDSETVVISFLDEEKEIFDLVAEGLGVNRSMVFRIMFGHYTAAWNMPFDVASAANRHREALVSSLASLRAEIDSAI